jgi:hypothetical protein
MQSIKVELILFFSWRIRQKKGVTKGTPKDESSKDSRRNKHAKNTQRLQQLTAGLLHQALNETL